MPFKMPHLEHPIGKKLEAVARILNKWDSRQGYPARLRTVLKNPVVSEAVFLEALVQTKADVLAESLTKILKKYEILAKSGDCGFMNPDSEFDVIKAHKVLIEFEELNH